MNDVAMQLYQQNPGFLSDRKALLEASRKKLDKSGYCYKENRVPHGSGVMMAMNLQKIRGAS